MSSERIGRWPWSRRPAPVEAPPASVPEAWAPTIWPPDAVTLERWIRTELLAGAASDSDGMTIDGLDGIRIDADVDGPDVTQLLVDATDVGLRMQLTEDPHSPSEIETAVPSSPAEPEIVSRTPGMLRSARVSARPLLVHGHPVQVDATVTDLPFDWTRYDGEQEPGRPTSAFGFEESDAEAHPSGTFSFSIRADHVAPLLTDIAAPLLASADVRLRRLDCSITASRRGVVTVRGLAAVRWKILGASVRVTASVHVSPDAVVTVKRLRLRSFNPLVAIALAMVRSELRAAEGEVLDLNTEIASDGAAPRLHDLRVTADDEVAISGRFG